MARRTDRSAEDPPAAARRAEADGSGSGRLAGAPSQADEATAGERRHDEPADRPGSSFTRAGTTTAALLALTFATGLVDAISYLGLGRVFTAFQTGNVVLLGFALAGAANFSVTAPAISLGAFLAGSMLGGQLLLQLGSRFRHWFSFALLAESLLFFAAAAIALLETRGWPVDSRLVIVALLAVAMGLRNATVRRLGVPDITTTVLTSTITGLGTDSWLLSTAWRRVLRRLSAIGAMLGGAVFGALLVKQSLVASLLLAGGLTALIGLGFGAPAIAARIGRGERSAAPQP